MPVGYKEEGGAEWIVVSIANLPRQVISRLIGNVHTELGNGYVDKASF